MALREGSLPARAIEHLQSLGDGARLSSEELAAALNYGGGSISTLLATAKRDGAILCEREGKRHGLVPAGGRG
jgi:hypothetical protein